jgi:fatty-acyl-CoA synthase
MHGLMMDTPLLISSLMRFADTNYPNREIVSVTVDNPHQRHTYREVFARTRKLANALKRLGIEAGERVGTLAWNDHRHFELYYALSGSGIVCHTINPRLYPEQVAYIVNHAEDRYLFVDPLVMPLIEALATTFKDVEGIVVMTDEAHMPASDLPNVICYETLIADESDEFDWPEFDERTASTLCYTSGTTGNPKGVLYSHRSVVLHAYAGCLPDVLAFSGQDCALMVVPMFHVNGWGIPYAAAMVGAKIVMPGPKMADGETLHALIEKEKVTVASGVPTIWLELAVELPRKDREHHRDRQSRQCRRCSLSALYYRGLRQETRRHGPSGLGHDRNEPAGNCVQDQARHGRAGEGGALPTAGETRLRRVRYRNAHNGRR